jgi:hypothetical protein
MRKNLWLLAFTLILLFIASEVALRIVFDIQPGEATSSQYFNRVDTLKVNRGLIADSLGIQIVDSLSAQIMAREIEAYHRCGKTMVNDNSIESELVGDIIEMQRPDFHSALKLHVQSAAFPATGLDSAISYYLRHPVNEYGFRSIPFRQYQGAKKKVLLLGDSFTWGYAASNVFASFSDNLLAKGYAVYNTGITATDPVQYHQIANKYIPLLLPDVVVMNIYLGNDVQYYSRVPRPYVPQVYSTNAGMLQTNFNGITVADPDSVFNIINDYIHIPVENSWFARMCSYTAIGSLLWRVGVYLGKVVPTSNRYRNMWEEAGNMRIAKPDINQKVRMVQQLCDDHGARLLVCVIPSMNQAYSLTGPERFQGFLDSIPYHLSPVKRGGYRLNYDGHFNDEGHEEYSTFLYDLIEDTIISR